MILSLQVRLLKRGLELLEAGGRIVYSTCSLNPVEDEAVLSAILAQMMGVCPVLRFIVYFYYTSPSLIMYSDIKMTCEEDTTGWC